MNENGGPKLMQTVVKIEWKEKTIAKYTLKKNAKCSSKIMQHVVQNEWKLYSIAKCSRKIMHNTKCSEKWMKTVVHNYAKCNQNWMKREKHCKMYSKKNAKCSPQIWQNVVQNEWKLYWNSKYSPNIMHNV